MTKKQIAGLRKQIALYREQQERLIATIKKYGGRLHQDDFDKEFEDITIKDGKAYRNDNFFGFVQFNLLLGGLYQGEWAKWFDLMQCMVKVGSVRLEGNLPNVYYCVDQIGAA